MGLRYFSPSKIRTLFCRVFISDVQLKTKLQVERGCDDVGVSIFSVSPSMLVQSKSPYKPLLSALSDTKIEEN